MKKIRIILVLLISLSLIGIVIAEPTVGIYEIDDVIDEVLGFSYVEEHAEGRSTYVNSLYTQDIEANNGISEIYIRAEVRSFNFPLSYNTFRVTLHKNNAVFFASGEATVYQYTKVIHQQDGTDITKQYVEVTMILDEPFNSGGLTGEQRISIGNTLGGYREIGRASCRERV